MSDLTTKLKEKLAFDQESSVGNATALIERFKAYPSESELFRRMEQMAREENARLAPLHAKMIACVEELKYLCDGRFADRDSYNILADLEKELE